MKKPKMMKAVQCEACRNAKAAVSVCLLVSTVGATPRQQKASRNVKLCTVCVALWTRVSPEPLVGCIRATTSALTRARKALTRQLPTEADQQEAVPEVVEA